MALESAVAPMLREKIAAGEVNGCRRPPFLFRSLQSGDVFELRAPDPPAHLHWDQQPLMIQAQRYLQMGLLGQEAYESIARYHRAWHRRLARWLVAKLQRFC